MAVVWAYQFLFKLLLIAIRKPGREIINGYLWIHGPVYGTVTENEALADLPPSAKLVYKVLEYEGELTQQRLAEETRLSTRTVRYALNSLESIELIEQKVYFADARKRLYSLPGSTETE